MRTPTRERVAEIRGRDVLRVCVYPVGESLRCLAQCIGRSRRQREEQRPLDRRHAGFDVRPRDGRGLFDDRVHVGSGETVGRHRCPSRLTTVGRPRGRGLRHKEFGRNLGESVGQTLEVQVLRDHAMLDRQYGFDQPEWARRGLGMPEIRLHRGQRGWAGDAVDVGEALVFDRVTDRRPGAVRLDHADRRGVHARRGQRRLIHGGLRGDRGHRDVDGVAVLVSGCSAQHGKHPVTVGQRVGQPLEQQHGAALAHDESIGRGVEGVATSGGRQHAFGGARSELAGLQAHRGAGSQGEIALPVVQAAAGQVDRKQS